MTRLVQLKLYNFRIFERLSWEPSPKINFIAGDNGAGKTSILEAIYYLSRNRSFRATSAREVINSNIASSKEHALASDTNKNPRGNDANIWAAFIENSIGAGGEKHKQAVRSATNEGNIRIRADGSKIIEFNGAAQTSATALATRLPLVLAAPHNINMVEAEPRHRRSFLDAILFHTSPGYVQLYRDYSRCLKQRNKLLVDVANNSANNSQLEHWDRQLAEWGEQMEVHRQKMLPLIIKPIEEVVEDWGLQQSSIEYYRGWDEDTSLAVAMQEGYHKDLRYGSTRVGCHRADFSLRVGARAASRVLSLGQQKMLSLAFFCAAALILRGEDGKINPLILLDDVVTQIDAKNCNMLLEYLTKRENQVFITSTSNENLLKYKHQNKRSFWRVKQGKIDLC